jgi:bacterioferritin-associated ferredoxin
MIVCICKAVSDKRIRSAASEGVVTLRQLSRELGVGTCCGKCVPQAREILSAAVSTAPQPSMAGMLGSSLAGLAG